MVGKMRGALRQQHGGLAMVDHRDQDGGGPDRLFAARRSRACGPFPDRRSAE